MVRYSMFLCLCIVVATVLFYVSWPVVSLTFFKDLSKKKKKRFVFAKRLLTLNNLQKTWRACLLEQFKKPVCFEDSMKKWGAAQDIFTVLCMRWNNPISFQVYSVRYNVVYHNTDTFLQGGPGHLYLLKNKVATFAKVEKEEDMIQ